MRHDLFVRKLRPAHQLIKRRQRARNFQGLENTAVHSWEKRRAAAGIARVEEIRLVVHFTTARIALPARGTGGVGFATKDPKKLRAGGNEFRADFRERHLLHVVLPPLVIVAMDADLE